MNSLTTSVPVNNTNNTNVIPIADAIVNWNRFNPTDLITHLEPSSANPDVYIDTISGRAYRVNPAGIIMAAPVGTQTAFQGAQINAQKQGFTIGAVKDTGVVAPDTSIKVPNKSVMDSLAFTTPLQQQMQQQQAQQQMQQQQVALAQQQQAQQQQAQQLEKRQKELEENMRQFYEAKHAQEVAELEAKYKAEIAKLQQRDAPNSASIMSLPPSYKQSYNVNAAPMPDNTRLFDDASHQLTVAAPPQGTNSMQMQPIHTTQVPVQYQQHHQVALQPQVAPQQPQPQYYQQHNYYPQHQMAQMQQMAAHGMPTPTYVYHKDQYINNSRKLVLNIAPGATMDKSALTRLDQFIGTGNQVVLKPTGVEYWTDRKGRVMPHPNEYFKIPAGVEIIAPNHLGEMYGPHPATYMDSPRKFYDYYAGKGCTPIPGRDYKVDFTY